MATNLICFAPIETIDAELVEDIATTRASNGHDPLLAELADSFESLDPAQRAHDLGARTGQAKGGAMGLYALAIGRAKSDPRSDCEVFYDLYLEGERTHSTFDPAKAPNEKSRASQISKVGDCWDFGAAGHVQMTALRLANIVRLAQSTRNVDARQSTSDKFLSLLRQFKNPKNMPSMDCADDYEDLVAQCVESGIVKASVAETQDDASQEVDADAAKLRKQFDALLKKLCDKMAPVFASDPNATRLYFAGVEALKHAAFAVDNPAPQDNGE